jgi:hypothetical protein
MKIPKIFWWLAYPINWIIIKGITPIIKHTPKYKLYFNEGITFTNIKTFHENTSLTKENGLFWAIISPIIILISAIALISITIIL